jgi:hypothetical protein
MTTIHVFRASGNQRNCIEIRSRAMVLTAAEVPVRLEALDQSGQRISEVEAQLLHLDENYALLSVEQQSPGGCLHWGTPVRFEVEEDLNRYEVTGAIIARREEAGDDDAGLAPTLASIPGWEIRIRIWDCNLNVQRRLSPRRRIGFPVELHVSSGAGTPIQTSEPGAEPILARCVDIGAGGIRVRTAKLANLPARMRLEFCLPITDGDQGHGATHKFNLAGRVIRALPQGRHGDNLDIAFCFEGLSVRDGMALHNLLA